MSVGEPQEYVVPDSAMVDDVIDFMSLFFFNSADTQGQQWRETARLNIVEAFERRQDGTTLFDVWENIDIMKGQRERSLSPDDDGHAADSYLDLYFLASNKKKDRNKSIEIEGDVNPLPHVTSFSAPLLPPPELNIVDWYIEDFSDSDSTPVLRMGETVVLLTPPVAQSLYRALGDVVKKYSPETVSKPSESLSQRLERLKKWYSEHKFIGTVSVVIVAFVLIGLVIGFFSTGGSTAPL